MATKLEIFERSLEQHKRCAQAELVFPEPPKGTKPVTYSPTEPLVAGQQVQHKRFGAGVVIEVWDSKAIVYFEEGAGLVTLMSSPPRHVDP